MSWASVLATRLDAFERPAESFAVDLTDTRSRATIAGAATNPQRKAHAMSKEQDAEITREQAEYQRDLTADNAVSSAVHALTSEGYMSSEIKAAVDRVISLMTEEAARRTYDRRPA